MLSVKKILSFLFFVYYNLYAFSAAPAAPGLGPNVRMEAALNVPIAAIVGVLFAQANLFDPALVGVGAAAIAVAGINAGPLGAVPAQIDVHSDTVAIDKFISYCHNASLGNFDTTGVAPGPQVNALINRLREFYSTDINDLSRVLYLPIPVQARRSPRSILTSDWDSDNLRHITLAAITIISRSQVPVGGAPPVPPQYDYRTFFFGDVFRSGENGSVLSAPFNANIFLPDHFFHIFGQNFPVPGGVLIDLHFSGNWRTVANRKGNRAHSEGAFYDFLQTAAAIPFNNQANLMTHIPNTQNIVAFIVHLKNREPMCRVCRSWVPASIRDYLCGLLLNAPIITCMPLTYDPPMKGMYLSPTAAAGAAAVPAYGLQGSRSNHFLLNSVISPSLTNIPIPSLAGPPFAPNQQIVKIVFIIGYGFKNVDILE
ncbi:MAG: hypothetical protein LBB05_00090 [Puniceicoccales bacterium]|jgi:hypothetical protein|nr:hypothetical protein [Puniceicoccales bacterium]